MFLNHYNEINARDSCLQEPPPSLIEEKILNIENLHLQQSSNLQIIDKNNNSFEYRTHFEQKNIANNEPNSFMSLAKKYDRKKEDFNISAANAASMLVDSNVILQNMIIKSIVNSDKNLTTKIVNQNYDNILKPIPITPMIFTPTEPVAPLQKNFHHDGLLTFVDNNWRSNLNKISLISTMELNEDKSENEQLITNLENNKQMHEKENHGVIKMNRRTSAPACLLSAAVASVQNSSAVSQSSTTNLTISQVNNLTFNNVTN